VIKFVREKGNTSFKGLVFDNANSSTVRYMKELAKISDFPKDKIFSFGTNNEVIDFVSKNQGMIGVVGVNWLYEPMPDMNEKVHNVKVLSVKDGSNPKSTFEIPDQDHMASGLYPLTREIKMLNYQGKSGLGMGFASFIAGEIGQRIILKSGLVPVRFPSRIIKVRNQIMNDK
jgi:phosphate transport system substrate-binding protein